MLSLLDVLKFKKSGRGHYCRFFGVFSKNYFLIWIMKFKNLKNQTRRKWLYKEDFQLIKKVFFIANWLGNLEIQALTFWGSFIILLNFERKRPVLNLRLLNMHFNYILDKIKRFHLQTVLFSLLNAWKNHLSDTIL